MILVIEKEFWTMIIVVVLIIWLFGGRK